MLDYVNSDSDDSIWELVGAVFISIALAVLIGWLMMTRFLTAGFMVLGAVAGFFLGIIFYNIALVRWV